MSNQPNPPQHSVPTGTQPTPVIQQCSTVPVCPVCGGTLQDIRHKLVCSRCHTICETCCEGGRG